MLCRPAHHPARGFTLVESLIACAVAALLAGVALPSMQGQRLRAGRLDAVAALTRVQAAQEQHRGQLGLYAANLPSLGLINPRSPQGLYAVSVQVNGPDSYTATATALGRQAQDSGCATLTLDVNRGFPSEGPNARCWQR